MLEAKQVSKNIFLPKDPILQSSSVRENTKNHPKHPQNSLPGPIRLEERRVRRTIRRPRLSGTEPEWHGGFSRKNGMRLPSPKLFFLRCSEMFQN